MHSDVGRQVAQSALLFLFYSHSARLPTLEQGKSYFQNPPAEALCRVFSILKISAELPPEKKNAPLFFRVKR